MSVLSVFLPDRWGRPDGGFAVTGPVNYAERTFYVGALPLMLAVAGLYRPRAGRQLFFVGLLVAGVVLAVHVPVVTDAVDELPGFAYVDLTRTLILASLSLAVLAGFGLERLVGADRRQQRVMLGLAGLVACVPLVWLVGHGSALRAFPRFSDFIPLLWSGSSSLAETAAAAGTRWLVLALAALGVLRLLVGGRRSRPAPRVALGLAVALAAADLLTVNQGYNPAITGAQAQPAATPSIVTAAAGQGSGRTAGFSEYLIPNVGSRYGLRDPRGHGLPALGRYLALWTRLGGKGFQATRVDPRDPRSTQLLDDFGVTTVLTTVTGGTVATTGLRLLARRSDGSVYRNPNALPRAFFASSWRALPTERDALGAVAAIRPAHLLTAPVIEGVAPPSAKPAGGGGAVRFTDDGGDRVSLAVDAPRAGYLVLLDSYYPGWRATVDGRDATIHPANAAFRAVAVPAGRHAVVFSYLPRTVVAGGVLSGLAWIAILGLVLVPRLGRRPVSPRRPRRPRR
ncbi:MAG TPA: YfhO family protein, partial [Solirubrobacteraceae bacterium]|nr:YfhO family protein [Solirubrobacteraceae bacterium]